MWNSRNRILIDTDGDDVAFLSGSGRKRTTRLFYVTPVLCYMSEKNSSKIHYKLYFCLLGESRNGLYGNSTGKRDLYERGHVAACSRGQAVALTVFIFSSIFFTSLAIAFVRPFTIEEAFGKISPSYLDHCDSELHSGW